MKNNNNERGVALIAAVMITAVLAGIGISFVFNMRLEEQAAANYLWKTQADAIAQGGIERTIRTIIANRNEQRTFIGTAGVHNPSQYGFAPLDVPLGDGLIARSEIVVRDEAGKVNLNTSGHPEILSPGTGFARPGIDRGWTTAEIKLPLVVGIADATWRRKFGPVAGGQQEGAFGVDDNRLLPDGTINPFGANSILGFDGIDNDGDGIVDNVNAAGNLIEGIDEPSEFRFLEGGRITLDAADVGDDRPFITLGETEISGDLSLHTTLYSSDRFTDRDVQWNTGLGGPGSPKININTATAGDLRGALVASGLTGDVAEQVALNIIDFRDADSIPSSVSGWNRPGTTPPILKRGIERTLFINEIREWRSLTPRWPEDGSGGFWPEWCHKVDRIELKNPWNIAVRGRYLVVWRNAAGVAHFIFREDVNEPPGGLILRSPSPPYHANAGGSVELYIDADLGPQEDWRMIERVTINSPAETRYYAKNDPRVPVFTYRGDTPSLGEVNTRTPQGFNPEASGEVSLNAAGNPVPHAWRGHFNHFSIPNSPVGMDGGRNFHNTGELGYIHTGEQWSTLRMRNVERPGGATTLPHQGAILNRVTIGHPYNRMGRININTASESVLRTLPQMDIQPHQVDNILNNRPFNTIGDAVPHLTARSLPPVVDGNITRLMRRLQDFANDVIHWPRTWWQPFRSLVGEPLHNWIISTLRGSPLTQSPLNLTIPHDIASPYQYTICICNPHNPNCTTCPTYTNTRPIYVNFFQSRLATSIVEGISRNVANIAQSAINTLHDWSDDWWNRWLRPFINEWIIIPFLNPIIEDARTLERWSTTGDNLDGDGFFEGVTFREFHREDDERETIVRSVSNLITTRSDRFEIISTGSIWREGAANPLVNDPLAESQMRVVVCRISDPVIILHFERR